MRTLVSWVQDFIKLKLRPKSWWWFEDDLLHQFNNDTNGVFLLTHPPLFFLSEDEGITMRRY